MRSLIMLSKSRSCWKSTLRKFRILFSSSCREWLIMIYIVWIILEVRSVTIARVVLMMRKKTMIVIKMMRIKNNLRLMYSFNNHNNSNNPIILKYKWYSNYSKLNNKISNNNSPTPCYWTNQIKVVKRFPKHKWKLIKNNKKSKNKKKS